MKEEDYYRSKSSSQIKIRTYHSASEIFANGESFEKILEQDDHSKNKLSKRKTLNFSDKKIISFKRYCRTISDLKSGGLETNNKLSNSDIISELSKEYLNESHEENSMYSYSQDVTNHQYYGKLQSTITNIKNKILVQNGLNPRSIETINSEKFSKIMDYEGSNLIIETFFKKQSDNLLVLKDKLVSNDSEKNKIKLILGKYMKNSSFLILNTISSRENLRTNENCNKSDEIKIIDDDRKGFSWISSGFLSVYEKNFTVKKVTKNISNKLQKGLDLIPSSFNTRESTNRTYKRKKIVINKATHSNQKNETKLKANKILNILFKSEEKENPQNDIEKSKEIKNIKKLNLNNKEIIRFNSDEILSTELGRKNTDTSIQVEEILRGGRVNLDKKSQTKSSNSKNISFLFPVLPSQKYIRKIIIIQRKWKKYYQIREEAARKIESVSRAYLLRKRVAEVTCLYYFMQSKIAKIEKIIKINQILPFFKLMQKIYFKQIKSKCLVLIKRNFHKFYNCQSRNNKSATYETLDENFYSDTETEPQNEKYKSITPIIRISDNNLYKKEGKRVHFNLEEDPKEIVKGDKRFIKKTVVYNDERTYIIVECQKIENEENNNILRSIRIEVNESRTCILPVITYLKIKPNFSMYVKKLQIIIKKFLFRSLMMYGYVNSFSNIQKKVSELKMIKMSINPQKFLKIIKFIWNDNLFNEGFPDLSRKVIKKNYSLTKMIPPFYTKKNLSWNQKVPKFYVNILIKESLKKISFIQKEKMVNIVLRYRQICKKNLISSTLEINQCFKDLKDEINRLKNKDLMKKSKEMIYSLSIRREKSLHLSTIIQTFNRIKTVDFIFTLKEIVKLNTMKIIFKKLYSVYIIKREHAKNIKVLTELYEDSQLNFLDTIKKINEIHEISLVDRLEVSEMNEEEYYESEEENWWIPNSPSKKIEN